MLDENKEYIETTSKDFQIFKDECWYWIQYFGIRTAWNISFAVEDFTDGTIATAGYNYAARNMRFTFCKRWSKNLSLEYGENQIRRTAFHEVLHLLFSGMYVYAFDEDLGYTQRKKEYDIQEHMVIATLENTVFETNLYDREILCAV